MSPDQIDELLHKGIEAAEKGYIHSAQVFLGQVAEQRKTPEVSSYLAYCLAKGQGRIHAAAKMCRESLKREPNNSLHYLILGRILLMSGNKGKAIDTFRQGLRTSPNPKIINELKKLGLRKPAVLKALKRNHVVNRALGRAFNLLGLR
ncbi:MAG: tetratricopeptide repeat protein [Deltaproteobacteria bacterium]|jgi:predicted Zn-dependent protease|nr:tetratricopeptide repeat protein [Deltaproteobacteria bacterium]MCW8892362.1 tetratricopeptide repeat protein [Deltaproteobacteria bacterium]